MTEEQRGYLEKIERSQRHLLNIINDLLNFSRIEARQIEYDVGRVPLQESIRSVAVLLVPQATEKQVELALGTCPERLAARADRVKVEQIILNLCTNAVKFTEPGGSVRVECADAGGGRVQVAVSDTGVGIAPEDRERVFEPFVQLGRGLTTQHEGTGLGLAISRDLARAMGGDLTVESQPGHGSTFTLTLPADAEDAGAS